jgi:hypothetical protein
MNEVTKVDVPVPGLDDIEFRGIPGANKAVECVRGLIADADMRIRDAMLKLSEAADSLVKRSVRASEDCDAMLANQPCAMSWTDWVESDLRMAKEARAEIEHLVTMKRKLEFVLRKSL